MGIKTSVLGGVVLDGEDAKKFVRQVRYGRPKRAAMTGYIEGKTLSAQMNEKGYAAMPKKKKAA